MSISYPITWPTTKQPRRARFRTISTVGVSKSPFTKEQQVYVHQGESWALELDYPPLSRAQANELIGALLSLNGREGTLIFGDYVGAAPRGTWVSPVVHGAHASGVKTLNIRGVDGLTWKAGDWLQLGSGSSTHLHKVTVDGAQSGSPSVGVVEIWPRTRAALADADAVVVSNAKGIWRLDSNEQEWDEDTAQIFGLTVKLEEAL